MRNFALTIGGNAAATPGTFEVLNPADETVVAACPQGTIELVDAAVASARHAFRTWSTVPDPERVAKLNAIADLQEAANHASRLECGTAWVNQHGMVHPLAPFGGVKNSGIGVEFNVDGLKEYTTIQVLNVAL